MGMGIGIGNLKEPDRGRELMRLPKEAGEGATWRMFLLSVAGRPERVPSRRSLLPVHRPPRIPSSPHPRIPASPPPLLPPV